MKKPSITTIAKVILIPVLYALVLRIVFGIADLSDLFSVMSITFLFCSPFIAGVLTIYFSSVERVKKLTYRFFAPWIVIFVFFFITLALSIEGWACWLMALPLFLLASSIGGLVAGHYKLRNKDKKLYISFLVLLPFFISPIEHMIGAIPGTYKAYTYIDIHASADSIWNNVTRVRTIPEQEDKGYLTRFMGFPRPVKAVLNYNGVGAHREAIFTKGLTFHETVLSYIDKKKMVFSIKAYPYEIPSTTMDSHIVVGGNYFDVLNGTYELQQLNDSSYRLYLYSHFKLSTTFNFYASWWARWIMQDIQNNILQVIKERAESKKSGYTNS